MMADTDHQGNVDGLVEIDDSTALHYAAYEGNEEELARHLLPDSPASAYLNEYDMHGRTPLMYAVLAGHVGCAEGLTESGADIEVADAEGSTVLHVAVGGGNYKMVKYLLDKGADVAAQNADRRTPLHLATNLESSKTIGKIARVCQGHRDYVFDLLDNDGLAAAHWCAFNDRHKHIGVLATCGANITLPDGIEGKTPLHWCAANESTSTAMMILKYAPSCIDAKDSEGRTAFHRAIESRNLDMATFLLRTKLQQDATADLDIQDAKSHTPLHLAAALGFYDAMVMLIQNGADPLIADEAGATAMHYAAQNSDTEGQQWCLMYLTQLHVADIPDSAGRSAVMWAAASGNSWGLQQLAVEGYHLIGADDTGGSSLHIAASAGYAEVVAMLVDAGADINAQDNMNQTPIFKACECGQEETVQLLLQRGAAARSLDAEGQTTLHAGALSGSANICEALIHQKVPVQAIDKEGRTALHCAAHGGFVACMRILVENGADVKVQDKEGISALHWASLQGELEAVQLLVDHGAFINAEDSDENLTPLDYARMGVNENSKCTEVISYLVAHGSTANGTDQNDWDQDTQKYDSAARVIQNAFRDHYRKQSKDRLSKNHHKFSRKSPSPEKESDRKAKAKARQNFIESVAAKQKKKHEQRLHEKAIREKEALARAEEQQKKEQELNTRMQQIMVESNRIKQLRKLEQKRREMHRATKAGGLNTIESSRHPPETESLPDSNIQSRKIQSREPKSRSRPWHRPPPQRERRTSLKDLNSKVAVTPEWKLTIAALTIQLYWRKYQRRRMASAARWAKKDGRKNCNHSLPDWISTVIVKKQETSIKSVYASKPMRMGSYFPQSKFPTVSHHKSSTNASPALKSYSKAVTQYSGSRGPRQSLSRSSVRLPRLVAPTRSNY